MNELSVSVFPIKRLATWTMFIISVTAVSLSLQIFLGPALFKFPWWRKSCFEAHTQVTAWATLQSFEYWDGSEAFISLSGHDGLQTLLIFSAGMAISSSETTHCLTSCFTRSKMNGGACMWEGGSRFLWALTVVKLPSVSIRAVTAPWAALLHPPF